MVSVGVYRFSRCVRVNVEQNCGRVGEFRVHMSVISTGMLMMERTNPWQPKRQDEDAEQGDDTAPRPGGLFSEDSHVAPTSPMDAAFSLLTTLLHVRMSADSMFINFVLPESI
jgi:hypothetical protein